MSDDNWLDINKRGDTFSITSKLADYVINPDWKDGYIGYNNPSMHNDYKFLWGTISASCEDIGSEIYKKIANYINNISNIDTCEIHSLYSFAKMYGYNESLLFTNFTLPTEILELVNIFSLNKAYITGPNSILNNTSKILLQSLSGNDIEYVNYIKDIFYNTLYTFCNMKYRENELEDSFDNPDGIIWRNNIPKYTVNLFKNDSGTDSDILLKKISLSVPMYFPERYNVDEIQKGNKKLTDFSVTEQIILNMELDRRALARNSVKNISKYSYERENKVLSYFRFITLLNNNNYISTTYDIDINKNEIISDNILSLIISNNDTYSLDTAIIENVAEKLTDLCLRISYIRETIKNQAQKYYMSGTENLVLTLVKETLFTTLYNNVSGFWRYISNNNLLDKKVNPNPDLKVDIIEYTDATEYFNIAANSQETSDPLLNTRYWENEGLYDGDISRDDLLTFYSKLGLDNMFTQVYDVTENIQQNSDYTLKGFLNTLFNAAATSASNTDYFLLSSDINNFSCIAYGNNRYVAGTTNNGLFYSDNPTLGWTNIQNLPFSGINSLTYGGQIGNKKFIAVNTTNTASGLYSSVDGLNWSLVNSTSGTSGWYMAKYIPRDAYDVNTPALTATFIAANVPSGLYKSTDGNTWTNITGSKITGAGSTIGYWNDVTFIAREYSRPTTMYEQYYLTNTLSGIYTCKNFNAWNSLINDTGTNGKLSGYSNIIAYKNDSSNNIIATNISTANSGLYFNSSEINDTTPAMTKFTNSNIMGKITSITYNPENAIYIIGTETSGLYYSNPITTIPPVVTLGFNQSNITSGKITSINWGSVYKTDDPGLKYIACTYSDGLYYSNDGKTWAKYAKTESIDTITDISLSATTLEQTIFNKYSGNSVLGDIPYANIKNQRHSSYQLHPFMIAFKQYENTIKGIKNLFDYSVPTKAICFSNIAERIDNYGNSINFWLDDNSDFSGYRSYYEQSDIKGNDYRLYQDSPFNFDALTDYLNNKDTFINTESSISSSYYTGIVLTDAEKNKISQQLVEFYNNIKELQYYKIYKYGKDTFGNVYMLYKKGNNDDEKGQLWIRLKNHPLPFPAYIIDEETGNLSTLGQVTNTTLNTLSQVLIDTNSVNTDSDSLTGKLLISNLKYTVSGNNNLLTEEYIDTLNTPINFSFTDNTKKYFNTTDITSNTELSSYFINELSGEIFDNSISFTGFYPTVSSVSFSDSPFNITFNTANMVLSSDYLDINIEVIADNVFNSTLNKKYYDKLNSFFDFGFNFNKDVLFLDYTPVGSIDTSYTGSNTMFGEINNLSIDLEGNKILEYLKETNHNLETLPQSILSLGYKHIDTIINEKNIYYIYNSLNTIKNSDGYYTMTIYLFRYNKKDGLSFNLYKVPIKYLVLNSTNLYKATISNDLLSIAFVSALPNASDTIGNYISGLENGIGGKTRYENILETSYNNGFTLIQFKISDDLPITYDSVKYFYKHTDLGFYPQYPGILGKNKIFNNPEIKNDSFYRLQLYVGSSKATTDFIYEQTFNAVSGIYDDFNSCYTSSTSSYTDIEQFLYSTSAHVLSTDNTKYSEPMKWFRKFDLSGNYLDMNELSAGIELSGSTLEPSSYIYHTKEEDFINYNNSFYPQLDTAAAKNTVFDFFTLSSININLDNTYTTAIKHNNEIFYIPYNDSNMLSSNITSFTNTISVPISTDISYNKFLAATNITSGNIDNLLLVSESITGGLLLNNYGTSTSLISAVDISGNYLSGDVFNFNSVTPITEQKVAFTTNSNIISSNNIAYATLSTYNTEEVFVIENISLSGSDTQSFNKSVLKDNLLILCPDTNSISGNVYLGLLNIIDNTYTTLNLSEYVGNYSNNNHLYNDIKVINDIVILAPYNARNIITIKNIEQSVPIITSIPLTTSVYDYVSPYDSSFSNILNVNENAILTPFASRYILQLDLTNNTLLEYAKLNTSTLYNSSIVIDDLSILLTPYNNSGATIWIDNDLSYGLLELDENYIIKIFYRNSAGIVTDIYFNRINDTVNTGNKILNNSITSLVCDYNYNGTIKSYNIELVDLQRKQFIIERI